MKTKSRSRIAGLPAVAAAELLAASLLMSATAVLPEQASAAPAPKVSKAPNAARRPAASNASSARNSAARASRTAKGRSATRTGGSSDGSTPDTWRTAPRLPQNVRTAIVDGVKLNPVTGKGSLRPQPPRARQGEPQGGDGRPTS